MLQRNKDYNKIKFTEPEQVETETKKVAKEQPSLALDAETPRNNSNRTILSAGQGSITDFGGPKKYIGSQTKNSIWDSDVIEKLSKSDDSGEKIKSERMESVTRREDIQRDRLTSMVESLQNTDLRKANSVAGISEVAETTYKAPSRNISIFDSGDFDRVPDKTAGEKAVEESRKVKDKDDSWKTIDKGSSTKSVFDTLFDKLAGQE
jgi:hypothetical protein